MEADSRRRGRRIQLWDSEPEDHAVEFEKGQATAVICPKLGRCEITGWKSGRAGARIASVVATRVRQAWAEPAAE